MAAANAFPVVLIVVVFGRIGFCWRAKNMQLLVSSLLRIRTMRCRQTVLCGKVICRISSNDFERLLHLFGYDSSHAASTVMLLGDLIIISRSSDIRTVDLERHIIPATQGVAVSIAIICVQPGDTVLSTSESLTRIQRNTSLSTSQKK